MSNMYRHKALIIWHGKKRFLGYCETNCIVIDDISMHDKTSRIYDLDFNYIVCVLLATKIGIRTEKYPVFIKCLVSRGYVKSPSGRHVV